MKEQIHITIDVPEDEPFNVEQLKRLDVIWGEPTTYDATSISAEVFDREGNEIGATDLDGLTVRVVEKPAVKGGAEEWFKATQLLDELEAWHAERLKVGWLRHAEELRGGSFSSPMKSDAEALTAKLAEMRKRLEGI